MESDEVTCQVHRESRWQLGFQPWRRSEILLIRDAGGVVWIGTCIYLNPEPKHLA